MTGKQVIDEIADDRVRFIAELRHHAAGEYTGASVPFQIDRAMCGFAVNFCPAVRTTRTLVFGREQIKAPELRIGHDFLAQRSTSARDDLDHSLHLRLDSAGNDFVCNVCLESIRCSHVAVRRLHAPHRGAATVGSET